MSKKIQRAVERVISTPRELHTLQTLQHQVEMSKQRLLRVNLFDVQNRTFPLTTAEFNDDNGANKNMFSLKEGLIAAGHSTNLSMGATVDAPTLICGVGILAVTEGFGLAVPGIMVDTPEVAEDTPCSDGCANTGQDNAVFEWGQGGWNYVEKFFSLNRVQMYVCRHYQIFDEWARDLGLAAVTNEYIGAGHALKSIMPLVRDTNDVMTAKGIGKQFIPQNVVSDGASGSECIGAPTAEVLWGAQRTPGVANRIFPLSFPLLIVPGMPLQINFAQTEGDECSLDAMRRDSVLDETAGAVKPSAAFNAALACDVGNADVWTVHGGCISLGLVLASYDVSPVFCLQYLDQMAQMAGLGNPALDGIYRNPNVASYLGGLMANQQVRHQQLGAIPDSDLSRILENIGRFMK